MKEFMLLMVGNDAGDASPEEMQRRMGEYQVWMKEMMERGNLKTGQPLEGTGALLIDKDTVLTDGPFLESKEIIGGYVIMRAEDREQAIELAKACPLLAHCRILVRPIMEVPA